MTLSVVFLHGFMGSAADFDPVAQRIRFPSRGIDLPGHGDRAKESIPDSLNELVANICDSLHGPTILVGYSMGARIALMCAASATDCIRGVFLESFSFGCAGEEERRDRRKLDADRAERLRTNPDAFLKEWVGLPMFSKLEENGLGAEIATKRSSHIATFGPEGWIGAYDLLSPASMPHLGNAFRELQVPVKVIAGEHDSKYVDALSQFSVDSGELEIEVVPGADHNVHATVPGAYGERLENFVKSVEKR